MQRLPVAVQGEFRGVKEGYEFPNDDGETVKVPASLRFELAVGDDVEPILLPSRDFDSCVPAFDWRELRKGDHVVLHGFAIFEDEGTKDRYGRPKKSRFSVWRGRVERVGQVAIQAA